MVVQIKSEKRENGTSFWDNLYRKRSTTLEIEWSPDAYACQPQHFPPFRQDAHFPSRLRVWGLGFGVQSRRYPTLHVWTCGLQMVGGGLALCRLPYRNFLPRIIEISRQFLGVISCQRKAGPKPLKRWRWTSPLTIQPRTLQSPPGSVTTFRHFPPLSATSCVALPCSLSTFPAASTKGPMVSRHFPPPPRRGLR